MEFDPSGIRFLPEREAGLAFFPIDTSSVHLLTWQVLFLVQVFLLLEVGSFLLDFEYFYDFWCWARSSAQAVVLVVLGQKSSSVF